MTGASVQIGGVQFGGVVDITGQALEDPPKGKKQSSPEKDAHRNGATSFLGRFFHKPHRQKGKAEERASGNRVAEAPAEFLPVPRPSEPCEVDSPVTSPRPEASGEEESRSLRERLKAAETHKGPSSPAPMLAFESYVIESLTRKQRRPTIDLEALAAVDREGLSGSPAASDTWQDPAGQGDESEEGEEVDQQEGGVSADGGADAAAFANGGADLGASVQAGFGLEEVTSIPDSLGGGDLELHNGVGMVAGDLEPQNGRGMVAERAPDSVGASTQDQPQGATEVQSLEEKSSEDVGTADQPKSWQKPVARDVGSRKAFNYERQVELHGQQGATEQAYSNWETSCGEDEASSGVVGGGGASTRGTVSNAHNSATDGARVSLGVGAGPSTSRWSYSGDDTRFGGLDSYGGLELDGKTNEQKGKQSQSVERNFVNGTVARAGFKWGPMRDKGMEPASMRKKGAVHLQRTRVEGVAERGASSVVNGQTSSRIPHSTYSINRPL